MCSVREHLGTIIQAGGGTAGVGHSSLEDAAATLGIVRWYVLKGPKTRTRTLLQAAAATSAKTSISGTSNIT
jgi:RNA exonuclease 1